METTRFQSMTARVAPFSLETSFRRTSTASTQSSTSSFDRDSLISRSGSPVDTINSIVFSYAQQPAQADLEESQQVAGILEPRPTTAQIVSMEQLLRSL